jgi:fructose-1,6-bisphosphatase I
MMNVLNILHNNISGKIGLLAFAEESPILIEESWNSKYIAVFDPLDGSTNIDVGIVTGIVE